MYCTVISQSILRIQLGIGMEVVEVRDKYKICLAANSDSKYKGATI